MRNEVRLYSLAGLLLVAASAAQAQTQATPQATRAQQEAACTADATQFCGEAIPDEQKIAACLRANRAKISQACQAVLK